MVPVVVPVVASPANTYSLYLTTKPDDTPKDLVFVETVHSLIWWLSEITSLCTGMVETNTLL